MTTPDDKPSSPFTTPRFLIAAAVVVLVAVLGVGLVFFGGNDDTDPAPPTASSTSSSSSSATGTSAAEAAGGDCDLAAGDQTVPVATPTDTEWELVGTVAAPTAPETVGPAVVDPDTGLRSCYTASPLGALYAAAGYFAALSNPEQLEGVITDLSAESAGRDALLDLLENDPARLTVTSSTRVQIAGFAFLNYQPDQASLSLALQANNGATVSLPLTLVREDDDWKVVPPPDGNISGSVQPLSSLAGYAAWAGA